MKLLLKGLTTTIFVVTAAACITQIGTLPLQDNKEEDTVEKSSSFQPIQEEQQNLDDCGYQEIVVDNPDKTKTIIIIPLECADEPVDSVCDPALKDPTENYMVDSLESISL